MSKLQILAVGDIVGPGAVSIIEKNLWQIRKEYRADAVIVNGENAAVGNGLDVASAKTILFSGADVITTGNHVWQKKEIKEYLDTEQKIIRPANYPPVCPGSGYTYCDVCGWRMLVINALGTIFLDALESPFAVIDRILKREEGRYDFAALDFHAEATSEKLAIANYFDGRIQIIFGTHTHVQTADAKIFPKGTGYITDLGMTGPENSILGVKSEMIIEKMTAKMPVRFEIADGPITLCGALFTYDTDKKAVISVTPIRKEFA
ncbi:MAG: TIGR00282 family metallophosphoesterase [Clostridia bacterium]|nr:TIGR00282 family metallophosphoesterase [Clostridia bacterium]